MEKCWEIVPESCQRADFEGPYMECLGTGL